MTQAFAERMIDDPTWPERILWSRLKRGQMGFHFQRQSSIRGFIVDFYCPKAKLVVELDGSSHLGREENDAKRDQILSRAKIAVLRFENSDVYHGMSAVLIRIWHTCYDRAPYPLKPFVWVESGYRDEETVEMRALRDLQEAKRLEQHEKRFVNSYRKRSYLRRGRKMG